MTLIAGIMASGGTAAEGWLEVAGDRIAAGGAGEPPGTPDVAHDGIVARGLVDLQVNGAAGVEVTGGDAALDRIDAAMLAAGVTSYLPTVVTTDPDTARRAVDEIGQRARDPASPVEGVHLEGPFISFGHRGRHRGEYLVAPALPLPAYYEHPAVRLVTLAPELPGAGPVIEALVGRGVTVSVGHSGATYEMASGAADAGAACVTHLFNGMAPLHHRRPGLVAFALSDERVQLGVIADGFHVDRRVLEIVQRVAGPRVVLVTDASPAAGAPPGRYELTGFAIERTPEGRAQTLDGLLAGSALLLDEAVRRWTDFTGVAVAEALAAASERPARLVALASQLAPGSHADLVLASADGHVERVMRRGRWVA
jgi:N-acetylglucosamine-6-phosphate deacetylase